MSYLEVYNEVGYDLLNPKHEGSRLEDLPKVWNIAPLYPLPLLRRAP